MTDLLDLSIAIPSYNGRGHLERCLGGLAQDAPEAEIIVVDGASSDGSADFVAAHYPKVQLLRMPNHGWAHATNRGLEVATRPFLLCLNSDAFPDRQALQAMATRLREAPTVGAVGPMLRNVDGSRQKVFGLWYWPVWREITRPTQVPVISGACLMLSRTAWEKVGPFDETLFLYNEELDWCHRAKDAGFRLELISTNVTHVGGGSTGRNPLLTYEEQRGFLHVASKHWPRPVIEGLRRAMQLEGWALKSLDPRSGHREMWARLESAMRREAYEETPYPVSGRGRQGR